ncbi:hypothetical protein [Candidatus Thiosymbion oneisti]|nr:hypothetical protein [Candidatus Thiosymbion oneisti]
MDTRRDGYASMMGGLRLAPPTQETVGLRVPVEQRRLPAAPAGSVR